MRSWSAWLPVFAVFAVSTAGCGKSTQTQCMTMGGPSALVTGAMLFTLDVYPDTVACEGNVVPPGSVPLLSHSFQPGDSVKLDIPPGMRTLVLTTFADAAGTMAMGSGCTTTELKPGSQVCINLMLTPAPDLAVVTDLAGVDTASCSGDDCPCSSSPDNCPVNEFCNAQQMCQPGCKLNSDCVGVGPATDGGAPRTNCNTTIHQCAECASSDQCTLGKLCSPAGVCTIGCDSTHACPGGLACCNSLCVDTTSDPTNCGTCGTPCAGKTNTCCASSCVALDSNADNCGRCGNACSSSGVATRHCVSSACAPDCSFGKGDCNKATVPNDGCETDTTLPANCGQCGVACASKAAGNYSASSCSFVPDGGAATCVYTCNSGFDDCDKSTAPDTNGCETNLTNDPLNCGVCANVCLTSNNSGTSCSTVSNVTSCGHASCNLNQADCDPDVADHDKNECETTANSTTHCGNCSSCLADTAFHTAACSPGSPNFCSYTCPCVTTHDTARSCDGTQCNYTCSPGFADCKADTASHTPDGCECVSATTAAQGTVGGCCPSTGDNCQVQKNNGFSGESYFDCVAANNYTQTEATNACTSHNNGACVAFPCVDSGNHTLTNEAVVCDNGGGTAANNFTDCNCWNYKIGAGAPDNGMVALDCTCNGTKTWH